MYYLAFMLLFFFTILPQIFINKSKYNNKWPEDLSVFTVFNNDYAMSKRNSYKLRPSEFPSLHKFMPFNNK